MSAKQFLPKDLPVDKELLNSIPIKGELNIEQLVFLQIMHTCQSALQDEELFAANVRLLLSTVPSHKRLEILKNEGEYKSTVEQWQYKYWCGVQLGTPEHPINGSPVLIEEEVVDWHKLFEIILGSLEECGVTWKRDTWTIEVGKVELEKTLPNPTPVFDQKFTPECEQPNPLSNAPCGGVGGEGKGGAPRKNIRPCAICSKHVYPGTGKFFKNRIVHKTDCLDVAKVKWVD